jgi:hypothetical protein
MFFFSFENKNPWNRFLLCFFWGCGSGCFICKVGWRGENKMKNIKKKRKEEEEKHATSTQ